MRQITIANVRNRAKNLSESKTMDSSICKSLSELAANGRIQDIERAIKNTTEYGMNIPFYSIMEMYDAVVSRGSSNDIERIGNIIIENSLPKVRDAKQTQTLLRRRLGRTKTKLNASSYITKSIENLINTSNSAQSSAPSTNFSFNPDSDSTNDVVSEMYSKMLETSIMYENFDRILENYDRISKRFNLEILFNENSRINGIADTVVELCNRIDTYTMPIDVKFNTVIETAWYGFESNNIEYSKSEILEAASDYFLFKEDGFESCKKILDTTIFYDKNKDMKNMDIFMEDEPEGEEINNTDNISESIMSYCGLNTILNEEMFTKSDGTADFEKIFNNFKKNELTNKPESKLKSLVSKLYSRSVSGIVEETPKFLAWLRSFFILGSGAIPYIGPVLVVIGYIADRCVQLHMEKDQVAKMVTCFNKEIEAANTKLNSTKDKQTKEKLTKYIDSLEKGTDKIRTYYEDLFDDDEEHPDSYSMGVEDSYDLDDDMFDFDEAFNCLSNSIEQFNSNVNIITEEMMYSLIRYGNLDGNDIINLASFAAKFPNVFYKDTVESAIKDSINDIKNNNSNFDTLLGKHMKSTSLNAAYNTLMTTEKEYPSEDINSAKDQFDALVESYAAIGILIDSTSNNADMCNIMEASFTNSLKMASMKLKNAMTKLSDKGKKASKNVDASLNNLTKGIERSLTNDNRESIIKGSILPSASKVIKAGILAAGVGYLINPVVSVIGVLGYLACSGKYKAKERQMIIDEIEIELKLCKKYIDIAESKNDMKALKELLTIQRNLERQLQRVKYKMKVKYGQKYYDTKEIE